MRSIRGAKIGMIFQEPMTSLNPVLTIGRQLTESLELHLGMNKKESRSRAAELLDLVGIPSAASRLDDYPHQFSGGMRQRVMIAIGVACQPKMVIADEPTTALDCTTQAQLLELMLSTIEGCRGSLVLVTHNLGVVARYAQRIYIMYAGKIVEQGLCRDIFYRPRHPYTIGLLKSVPRLDEVPGPPSGPHRGHAARPHRPAVHVRLPASLPRAGRAVLCSSPGRSWSRSTVRGTWCAATCATGRRRE